MWTIWIDKLKYRTKDKVFILKEHYKPGKSTPASVLNTDTELNASMHINYAFSVLPINKVDVWS